MKATIFIVFFTHILVLSSVATNYYVATNGSDSNNGTSISTPLATVTAAIGKAKAGDVINIREGEYQYTNKIGLSRNGTVASPIIMQCYQNEKVVIDFSQMATSSSNRGFSLSGDYWHIKGLHVHKAGDNGMFISGNKNTIENCVFFANRDTGLQLGNGASNNSIINCDSYGNADPTDYGDADGFACKMDVGSGNYFYGCRAWLNVDDGWDGYLRGTDDVSTTIENCWTWMNGYFLDGTDGGSKANGNGFKVGGSDDRDLMHNFTLINCVAFDNKSKGFDQNNNKGNMYFHNCTGYRNKGNNYSIPLVLNAGKEAEVANCVAIDGKISLGSFVSEITNTWNGFSFNHSDFESLDTTGVSGPRQADGSLPDLNLFKLVEGSDLIDGGTDLGYSYLGNAPDLGAFEFDDGSTAIEGLSSRDFKVEILQNPAVSVLLLSIEANKSSSAELQLIAITGTIIHTELLQINQGLQTKQVSLTGIKPGLYLMHLSSSNVTGCIRFVVEQ